MKPRVVPGCLAILLTAALAPHALAQQSLEADVAEIRTDVDGLTVDVDSMKGTNQGLEGRVTVLEGLVAEYEGLNEKLLLCSSLLKFYAPANAAADMHGCVDVPRPPAPERFPNDVLHSAVADTLNGNNRKVVVNFDALDVDGMVSHISADSLCKAIGPQGYSRAQVFLIAHDGTENMMDMCLISGTLKGESNQMRSGQNIVVPDGTAAIRLEAHFANVSSSQYSRAHVRVDIHGKANSGF